MSYLDTKKFDQYFTAILTDIEIKKQVDYGNKASVRRCNAANDRIRKHLLLIDKEFLPNDEIINYLLSHSESRVISHTAVVMQDFVNCTTAQKLMGLKNLKKLIADHKLSGPDALTLSMLFIPKAEAKLLKEVKGNT